MDKCEPEDKYLNINELRLHYLDWGGQCKQPMLLLHGFMGHAHVWDIFALEFRNSYHVISLDQRGHGESDWSQKRAYSIDDHFSDICRLAEILHLDRMILIGHSMGGRNALFYAACFPEKVDSLVLVDARPSASQQSSNALMELLVHFPLQADTLEQVVESIREIYPLLPYGFARHIASHGYKKTEDGKYVPKYDTRMSLQCQRSRYSVEDLWPFVTSISCPTLIVRGERSPFLSKEDAKNIVDHLPRGSLGEISHSTHVPVQENPEEFNDAVRHFLNSAQ
jgi:pimeloyl-ACP methyl ester carboxylesterase